MDRLGPPGLRITGSNSTAATALQITETAFPCC